MRAFTDCFVSGSSHPKTFADLPPLQWNMPPTAPVLLVDDLATSGCHVEEAGLMLRSLGRPALALTWISGMVVG